MIIPNSKVKSLLDEISDPEQQATAKAIAMKFVALGFIAMFTRVEAGPVVTTYYFKPLPTSPLSKIMSKSEDIALAVGVESILIQRILDEISISVPNRKRSIISFDACLFDLVSNYRKTSILPILMGKDQTGKNINLDLYHQPHILIAGSTGGGKSVFLSELICSLAVTQSQDNLKFVLVDTKQLDLTMFSALDHVIEMVDNTKELYDVMDMLTSEVRKRTEMMKGQVRNLAEWNQKNLSKKKPYIVLVIDELADVMGQDREIAKTEDKDDKRTRISTSLATLAQISRAAGIHIIAATQRPSVKILNGDIKTNFPTRISFKLPSQFDSRVILDESGAEALLGKGDYLYKTAENPNPRRGHGAFVSTEDIKNIIAQHEAIRRSFEYL